MSGLFFVIMFLGLLPIAWAIPFIGILLWCWITFMSPHQLVSGFGSGLRLNLMIAVVTLLGWIFWKERKRFPLNTTVILIFFLTLLTTLSTALSMAPEISWPLWERHIKTFFLIFMIMAIMHNRVRIQALVWMTVISIGYYSVQGGLIGIASGGNSHIFGPPNSQITDNNALALAMVVVLPLINYLRIQSERRSVQLILLGSMALSIIGILSTYSRGGLISLVAMLSYLCLKSNSKRPA
ncbi:MAG: putative O-glycosylation ligase, exosortase A system-associated [Alphaproteobacteria bacterium]|nr:putative O-glycosylation ligase, exosortase A system-associated [Alphaproteobacteria bacterium]